MEQKQRHWHDVVSHACATLIGKLTVSDMARGGSVMELRDMMLKVMSDRFTKEILDTIASWLSDPRVAYVLKLWSEANVNLSCKGLSDKYSLVLLQQKDRVRLLDVNLKSVMDFVDALQPEIISYLIVCPHVAAAHCDAYIAALDACSVNMGDDPWSVMTKEIGNVMYRLTSAIPATTIHDYTKCAHDQAFTICCDKLKEIILECGSIETRLNQNYGRSSGSLTTYLHMFLTELEKSPLQIYPPQKTSINTTPHVYVSLQLDSVNMKPIQLGQTGILLSAFYQLIRQDKNAMEYIGEAVCDPTKLNELFKSINTLGSEVST